MKIAIILVLFLSVCLAQEFFRVLPWATELQEVELGMKIEKFMEARPQAQSLAIEETANYALFSGSFFEPGLSYADGTMLYNFKNGILTSAFWANKKNNSLTLTETVRKTLLEKHGEPAIGYSAKIQNDLTVKIVHEIFDFDHSSPLKIALSSSEDGLEVLLLNPEIDKENNAQELFFSYEDQVQLLAQMGIKESSDKSEEIVDILAEIRRKAESKDERQDSDTTGKNSLRFILAFGFVAAVLAGLGYYLIRRR